MTRRLTGDQVDALAESVWAVLERARSGELAASTPTVYRLEGALAALEAVSGRSGNDLWARLLPSANA